MAPNHTGAVRLARGLLIFKKTTQDPGVQKGGATGLNVGSALRGFHNRITPIKELAMNKVNRNGKAGTQSLVSMGSRVVLWVNGVSVVVDVVGVRLVEQVVGWAFSVVSGVDVLKQVVVGSVVTAVSGAASVT